MNKFGQMNILSFTAGLLVFLVLWGAFLGKMWGDWMHNAIVTNGYTGILAFAMAYINLWIFLLVLIVCAFAYGGGVRQ